MPLDYNSLLLAVGFAGAGLAVTMFGSWLSARADGFRCRAAPRRNWSRESLRRSASWLVQPLCLVRLVLPMGW